MKKLFLFLGVGMFGRAGMTRAQSTPNFEGSYAQLLQYAQNYSSPQETFEKISFDHQLGIDGTAGGVSFKATFRSQGKHDRTQGDLQTSVHVEGELAEGPAFFAQMKLTLEAILKNGELFYKMSDVSIQEMSDTTEGIGDYLDTELINQRIKTDDYALDLGIGYADASLLKSSRFGTLSLPSYPLWEVVSQEGNVFHLKWNKINLAKFFNEHLTNDALTSELLGALREIFEDLEETPITMKVENNVITLSFAGAEGEFRSTFSNTSLSITYQENADLFYLIMKKGSVSDKLGFIVVSDGVVEVLGVFDIKVENPSTTSHKTSVKGSIKTLESAFDDDLFNINVDYLGQINAITSLDIQAPEEYIDLEEYYRGDYYDDTPDFEGIEEYYDYYYAEEQAKYGTFCTDEQPDCKIITKSEVLAIPTCKNYIDRYSARIATMDNSKQDYYVKDVLNDLAKLQTLNINFATYHCDIWNGWLEGEMLDLE